MTQKSEMQQHPEFENKDLKIDPTVISTLALAVSLLTALFAGVNARAIEKLKFRLSDSAQKLEQLSLLRKKILDSRRIVNQGVIDMEKGDIEAPIVYTQLLELAGNLKNAIVDNLPNFDDSIQQSFKEIFHEMEIHRANFLSDQSDSFASNYVNSNVDFFDVAIDGIEKQMLLLKKKLQ
ncbi:hypothetical protein [Acanthopleuribacter pedis]|uniref:Uncharacterized protein n=1 Tax=Acanthopleuribacter pedis TaxID=442870 RepID=A0A8J7U426_9BACT|nr:hypothetical protein [Acanthopleuribacter pedis]MBO1319379.1 hypothetical protein [Acanthopleuribacter pedis]